MKLFADIYRGKRVLITGHTGFKGSWLTLWLCELGATVTGIALPPESNPSHWQLLNLHMDDRCLDIRDASGLNRAVEEARPEIIFHLAAQALVRRSYGMPLDTWSTNVMGTANLLEACRHTDGVRAVVVVTTDKCYENREWPWGYREIDRLGGHDPYSASKAATEMVAASYRSAFFDAAEGPILATARAGNVIGGGDWSEDRLIPDLVRAVEAGKSLEIRSPHAIRPWQHVLEPLSGYLMLGQKLLEGKREFANAWNFGPEPTGRRTVAEMLAQLALHWPALCWHVATTTQPHEATLLHLDSSKANRELQWSPVWRFDQALAATADWYRVWAESGQPESLKQLAAYVESAREVSAQWVCA